MAMLTPPLPRPKPQMTETLREPPPTPAVAAYGGPTPQDVARRRQIAEAMAGQAGDASPIASPWQGVARNIIPGLLSAWDQYQTGEQEKKGKQSAQDALTAWTNEQNDPSIDPKTRMAHAMALADNPWLGEGARQMLAQSFKAPETTDAQRNFEYAKTHPEFQGYQESLRQPMFAAPPGYAIAPDSKPGAPKVVRAEGLPPDPNVGGKPLNSGIMNDIKELGSALQGTQEFVNTFNDTYGGKGENLVGGEMANWLQSDIPGIANSIKGITGLDTGTPEAADWWRRYQEYKNTVRHGKFGGALTPNEQAQFDQESITPNMTPERIRIALANQARIIHGAVMRQRGMLLKSGYSADAVDAGLGLDATGQPDQQYQPAPSGSGGPSGAMPTPEPPRPGAGPATMEQPIPNAAPVVSAQPNGQGAPTAALDLPPDRNMLRVGKPYKFHGGIAIYRGNGQFETQ